MHAAKGWTPNAAEKTGVEQVLVNYLVTGRMVHFHSARLGYEQLMAAQIHW
jgi:hypothetical protein